MLNPILMACIRTLFFSKKNDPRISFMLRTCGLHLQDATKKLTIDYSSAEDPTKWKTGKIWKEYMNVKAPTKIGSLFFSKKKNIFLVVTYHENSRELPTNGLRPTKLTNWICKKMDNHQNEKNFVPQNSIHLTKIISNALKGRENLSEKVFLPPKHKNELPAA